MAKCLDSKCDVDVIYAAVENQRNGKWTIVPLEKAEGDTPGDFDLVPNTTHEVVNILGEMVGEYPVATYLRDKDPTNNYRTHSPSHFLGDSH